LGDLQVTQFFYQCRVGGRRRLVLLESDSMDKNSDKDGQAWWKFGHVWLVISGPAIVVVAGFVTLYLAVTSPNEIVTDATYQQTIETTREKGLKAIPAEIAPALQARNHAATGIVPIDK